MHDLFEQLDDPVPFEVTSDLVTQAKARGSRLRRRRRIGLTGMAIPVVLVLALVAGAVYVDHRLDQVQRVDVAAGVLATPVAGEPFNVLVVGTDRARDDEARRSDTIMVVRVDRSADHLTVLPLPRDLVFDGATGASDRLNSVLPRGGPDALIDTIHDHLGIDIAHYVEIDFEGFVKLIDVAGGISVRSSAELRDASTGLELEATCQHLDGTQALQLTRARHVEHRDGTGEWKADPSGDLGRIQRQQVILQLVFDQLVTLSTDPATLDSLLDVFADNTTIDAGLDRSTILDLVHWGRGLTKPNVAVVEAMPFFISGTLDDGSVALHVDASSAVTIGAAFEGRSTLETSEQLPNMNTAEGAPFTLTSC